MQSDKKNKGLPLAIIAFVLFMIFPPLLIFLVFFGFIYVLAKAQKKSPNGVVDKESLKASFAETASSVKKAAVRPQGKAFESANDDALDDSFSVDTDDDGLYDPSAYESLQDELESSSGYVLLNGKKIVSQRKANPFEM